MTPTTEIAVRPAALRDRVGDAEMLEFFRAGLGFPSVSGQEAGFTQFVAEWGQSHDLRADLWEADEAALSRAAPAKQFARHLPLAGRPTLVLELPGDPDLPSLIFNAHADVVAPGEFAAWRHDPWAGDYSGGLVYGRGACDAKGPLVSALWAMRRLADEPARRGSVLLELVPGEEDCVGLGTLTSVARGWNADAVVVLEPTEGLPRCASRPGCRFEIETLGRSVHGTVKWLGRDAIAAAAAVLAALGEIEAELSRIEPDPLFAAYPLARPVTVDTIQGGRWQGMVCDRCLCGGYFELLPADDVNEWQRRFETEVKNRMELRGTTPENVQVRFVERYDGHRLDPSHPLCGFAAAVTDCAAADPFPWSGFNSGCEAGLRANLHGTPTLVWGPGSLAHAHAADEHVAWADVRKVAEMLTAFADRWTRG